MDQIKTGMIHTASILLYVAKSSHDALDENLSPTEPTEAYPHGLIAIVFAASAFEAFVNELAELTNGTGDTPGVNDPTIVRLSKALCEAEDRRRPTRVKYKLAGKMLGKGFDRDRSPWQDLDLLIDIRNAIMHLRPTRFSVGGEGWFSISGEDLVAELRQRTALPSLPPKSVMATWLNWLVFRAVARWAVNTTVQAVLTIVSALPEGQFKESVAPVYFREFVEIP